MSDDIELSPPPGALIQSLRSLGYSTPTAVADLIDNSITAKATEIVINMYWGLSAEKSTVTVSDNGEGMTFKELKVAMTPGSTSPSEKRFDDDLVRFGVGMKTASWSMGRLMTVKTKKKKNNRKISFAGILIMSKRNENGPPRRVIQRRLTKTYLSFPVALAQEQ